MLEFEIIETLKPNNEILKVIKDYTYKVKKGTIKHLLHTNLQAWIGYNKLDRKDKDMIK